MNQIKRFTDQNLSWLIVDRKQVQVCKSKILFSCYAALNSGPFFLPVLFDRAINTNQYHARTWCNRLLQICDRKESSLT